MSFSVYDITVPVMVHGLNVMDDYLDHAQALERTRGFEPGRILGERLAMYRRLREEAARAGTPAGHDAFHESYVRFVKLVQSGELGGARFTAEKL